MGLFSKPKTLEQRNLAVAKRDTAAVKAYAQEEKAKLKRDAVRKAKYDVLSAREKFGENSRKINQVKTSAYRNLTPRVGYNTGALRRLKRIGR